MFRLHRVLSALLVLCIVSVSLLIVLVGAKGLGAEVDETFEFVVLQLMHVFFLAAFTPRCVQAARSRRWLDTAICGVPLFFFLLAVAVVSVGRRIGPFPLMLFDVYVLIASVHILGRSSATKARAASRSGRATLLCLVLACRAGPPATTIAPASGVCDAPADLVLIDGSLLTMVPERPSATALAIRGGEIVAVGGAADMRALVGEHTQIVSLEGRGVTPGLVDGHAHLYGLGVAMARLSLEGYESERDAAAAVGHAARELETGEWLTGRGWDQTLWSPREFPSRASLDALSGDHPVAVRRVDGHALWANSRALALAGITRASADPAGGKILRDDAGEPTGVFLDNAMALIESRIPSPTHEMQRRFIRAAARAAVAQGLTGVHEMGISDEIVAVYRELAAEGELPLRVYAFLSYEDGLEKTLAERERNLDDGGPFVLRAVKLYADGALGSRGAALLEPYDDDSDNSGLLIADTNEIARVAELAAAAGWQVGVHAIGDRANRAALDAFERVVAARPGADLRFRVEHAQVLSLDDIPRFAALGVLAAMQPTHCTSDMRWAEARLGAERIKGAYAWRSILDSGGRIVGGSDFPVEGVSPLLGIYAAVSRQDANGQPERGWFPDQRLTLEEAIRLFTVEPAYAAFAEKRRGRLAPGFDADVTVFDRALAADRSLLKTGIELTLVGGRPVFSSAWAEEELAAARSAQPQLRTQGCR